MAIHTISCFAGGGMLDVGVELAFGPIFDCLAYVECEAYAVAVLAAAMEQGRIHPAPVWSDARSVCGPLFGHYVRQRLAGERLGAIIAGYPCPDFSCAGTRAGTRGVKGALWWSLAEAIAEYEPELLFLENVGGHTSQGFDTVCSAIRQMGYRIAAGLFTASETGASHKRERLFILASRQSTGGRGQQPQRGQEKRTTPGRTVEELADANRRGTTAGQMFRRSNETSQGKTWGKFQSVCGSDELSDAGGGCLPLYPPRPDDLETWRRIIETHPLLEPAVYGRLNPCFVEALMGWPMYWTETGRNCNHDEWARRQFEALRVLCEDPTEEAVQRSSGRQREFSPPEVLRQEVHGESDGYAVSKQESMGATGKAVTKKQVRKVRGDRNAGDPSQKQEVVGQPQGEYWHALRVLSHYAAPCKRRYCTKEGVASLSPLWVLDLWQESVQHLSDADKAAWETASRENKEATIIATARQIVKADRAHRLRLCGNGVVPLEAAYAYTTLAAGLWDGGSTNRGGSKIT